MLEIVKMMQEDISITRYQHPLHYQLNSDYRVGLAGTKQRSLNYNYDKCFVPLQIISCSN